MSCNRVRLCGEIREIDALRYTPGGIPRCQFTLVHQSEQLEAGAMTPAHCEMGAYAFGDVALHAARLQPGQRVRCEGFITRKSIKAIALCLHINEIQIIE